MIQNKKNATRSHGLRGNECKEVASLRAQRGREQAYQRASGMFSKVRKVLAADRPRPGGTCGVLASALIPPPVLAVDPGSPQIEPVAPMGGF
jgi:hypothetical protein